MNLMEAGQDLVALREVERRDDLFCSSHWLTPNCSRMSSPLRTMNFSSNFSLSSRCHWKARLAGANDQDSLAMPRSFSSRNINPAMIVLPAPASSARRNRTRASFEQIVVNSFELMRQRIDARDREAEVRVEFVGDA